MFSGTVYEGVYGKKDIFDFTDRNYTHAYWNKDAADPKKNPGGDAKLTPSQETAAKEQGLYFWQATTYMEVLTSKSESESEKTPILGVDYLTDNGKPPTYSTDRVYVKKEITNAYELAMALAIQHTMQEIEKFYQAVAPMKVNGIPMQEVLKMNGQQLGANSIKFETYPDKRKAYGD